MRGTPLSKMISCVLSVLMIFGSNPSQAQKVIAPVSVDFPSPLKMNPRLNLNGIIIDAKDPLSFDFLVTPLETRDDQTHFEAQTKTLVQYFLNALAFPKEDFWVNLSPYEKNRIAAPLFGQTPIGRDLLAQDYELKRLASSMMNPDTAVGQKFWQNIYQSAAKQYHTTQIPINTLNKIWIVPDQAMIHQEHDRAFIVRATMKVMIEEDYLAMRKASGKNDDVPPNQNQSQLSNEITRQIIIPQIEKAVNEGEEFATLRRIYHAYILADWFKERVQTSFLNQAYTGQRKLGGLPLDDQWRGIYQNYLSLFKKGLFNFVREETDLYSGQNVARKYFAGGLNFQGTQRQEAPAQVWSIFRRDRAATAVKVRLNPIKKGAEQEPNQDQAPKATAPDAALQVLVKSVSEMLKDLQVLVVSDAVFDKISQYHQKKNEDFYIFEAADQSQENSVADKLRKMGLNPPEPWKGTKIVVRQKNLQKVSAYIVKQIFNNWKERQLSNFNKQLRDIWNGFPQVFRDTLQNEIANLEGKQKDLLAPKEMILPVFAYLLEQLLLQTYFNGSLETPQEYALPNITSMKSLLNQENILDNNTLLGKMLESFSALSIEKLADEYFGRTETPAQKEERRVRSLLLQWKNDQGAPTKQRSEKLLNSPLAMSEDDFNVFKELIILEKTEKEQKIKAALAKQRRGDDFDYPAYALAIMRLLRQGDVAIDCYKLRKIMTELKPQKRIFLSSKLKDGIVLNPDFDSYAKLPVPNWNQDNPRDAHLTAVINLDHPKLSTWKGANKKVALNAVILLWFVSIFIKHEGFLDQLITIMNSEVATKILWDDKVKEIGHSKLVIYELLKDYLYFEIFGVANNNENIMAMRMNEGFIQLMQRLNLVDLAKEFLATASVKTMPEAMIDGTETDEERMKRTVVWALQDWDPDEDGFVEIASLQERLNGISMDWLRSNTDFIRSQIEDVNKWRRENNPVYNVQLMK